MAYSPIAFTAPNYRDYNNDWLKAYEPGTTTPKVMALEANGGTPVAMLQLNADGFIVSAGNALVIPYINGAYDLWLFPTSTAAAANDTSNAVRLADNITGVADFVAQEGGLVPVSETVTLIDGQTLVIFTEQTTAGAEFHINGQDIDSRKLTSLDINTGLTTSTSITLYDSYPAGALVTLAKNSSTGVLNVSAGDIADLPEFIDSELINDLSQAYEFESVDDAKTSTIVLPLKKIITIGMQRWEVTSDNTGVQLNDGKFIKLLNASEIPVNAEAKTRFIAHRGLSSIAPENTISSYSLAANAGFWAGECDIQLTSDNVWVLMHDSTVDRTTNGTGLVKNLTLAQIKALDAGSWFSAYFTGEAVPTLDEYLSMCKRKGLNPFLEIKATNADITDSNLTSLIASIEKFFPDSSVITATFEQDILLRIRGMSSKVNLQYFIMTYDNAAVDFAVRLGNCGLAIDQLGVGSDLSYANDNNIYVMSWTINDFDIMNDLLDVGVKQILTDFINGESS